MAALPVVGPALAARGASIARSEMDQSGWRPERDPGAEHRGVVAIASGNGLAAVDRAYELAMGGADPADAVVEGVGIVEADPEDITVGLGGLPNEEGVVQLDSCVMHGPSHKAGAVACLEDTLHPAQVALAVLRTTDHVLIVGKGAKRFARAHGFGHHDMLTDETRVRWLQWKRNLNPNDDWLDDDQEIGRVRNGPADRAFARVLEEKHVDVWFDACGNVHTTGTIHCSVRDPSADLAGCTTTSGLAWKIPGRVGDSPLIGAGNYTDNGVGSAGATGRGEAAIQSLAAYSVVREMESGMTPTEACLETLRRVARNTKRPDLLRAPGEPNFGLTLYAVRKDGAYGSATMRGSRQFAVATAQGARREACAPLY